MELINQHTKKIMEGCKDRAREAGLKFQDESLEYIVTNKDLIELGPKNMIPTLYDYWVHDVEVLREKGKYELYPQNPFETVINTRPAISFYNDNNPDWLNVMIFYHVLAHIDFFQNNMLFRHTWNEDFAGQALSDKRSVAALRSEKGRWVDYVIEFARGMDNLVGFYKELSDINRPAEIGATKKLDFYFDIFLQNTKKVSLSEYLKEIERYNEIQEQYGHVADSVFFSAVTAQHPEFEALYKKHVTKGRKPAADLLQFFQDHSPFLKKEENRWMKTIIEIVRNTSLYFQPQIRTKILNEGWASYWHDKLFLSDERIRGNEIGYARINAFVTALPRLGINPYALGMRLYSYLEKAADKGRISWEFQRMHLAEEREKYDRNTTKGIGFVFDVRENFSDFMFINTFVDQDFVDEYKVFVTGKELDRHRGVWKYYIKSRKAEDYKKMVLDSLYHPPFIEINEEQSKNGFVYLNHHFEGKPLVKEFIQNTMLGLEYLWGGPIKLETTEFVDHSVKEGPGIDPGMFQLNWQDEQQETDLELRKVVYVMENKKLTRSVI